MERIIRWQVPKEETYAFGDSVGDLPMVRFCGTGVAMGNGEQLLKDEDGISRAFRHFGLA